MLCKVRVPANFDLWMKHLRVTIQMKAIEQYYFQCGTKNYVVQGGFNLNLWMVKHLRVTIQMKAIERYFHFVAFQCYSSLRGSFNLTSLIKLYR